MNAADSAKNTAEEKPAEDSFRVFERVKGIDPAHFPGIVIALSKYADSLGESGIQMSMATKIRALMPAGNREPGSSGKAPDPIPVSTIRLSEKGWLNIIHEDNSAVAITVWGPKAAIEEKRKEITDGIHRIIAHERSWSQRLDQHRNKK